MVFKNGGSPPPRFSQIGGLPLYTKQPLTNTMKSKDSKEEYPVHCNSLCPTGGRRGRLSFKILAVFLLVSMALCGCAKQPSGTDGSDPDNSMNASTQADPINLEQLLLKERGMPYEQSDYKTFVGGEGLLNFDTVFTDTDPAVAKGELTSVFLSGGKLYKFSTDSALPNGKSCMETYSLPDTAKPIYFHSGDFNGADLDVIFSDGKRFSLDAPSNNGPYTAKESKFGMIFFEHTYQYSSDGKTLSEIPDFRSRITRFDPGSGTVIADGKLYIYAAKQDKSNMAGSTLYFDDKNGGVIIWEANCSAMSDGEKIITLFNGNILVTDKAFYRLVYDAVPDNSTDYSDKITNSNGTEAEHLPKFGGGDRYRLKRIEKLTAYYDEIATITHSAAITHDNKILPLTEIIPPENEYGKYSAGKIEIPPNITELMH